MSVSNSGGYQQAILDILGKEVKIYISRRTRGNQIHASGVTYSVPLQALKLSSLVFKQRPKATIQFNSVYSHLHKIFTLDILR